MADINLFDDDKSNFCEKNNENNNIIKNPNLLQMSHIFEVTVYKNSFVEADSLINSTYSNHLVLATNFIEFWITNMNSKNKIQFCKSFNIHKDECFMIKECRIRISDFRVSNKTDIIYQKVQGSDKSHAFHIPISKYKYHANKNNFIGSKIKLSNIVNSECYDKTTENVFDLYKDVKIIPINSYIEEVWKPRPIWISDFELSDNYAHQIPQVGYCSVNFKNVNFKKGISDEIWIPDILKFGVVKNSDLKFVMQQKTTILIADRFKNFNFNDVVCNVDRVNIPITYEKCKNLNTVKNFRCN